MVDCSAFFLQCIKLAEFSYQMSERNEERRDVEIWRELQNNYVAKKLTKVYFRKTTKFSWLNFTNPILNAVTPLVLLGYCIFMTEKMLLSNLSLHLHFCEKSNAAFVFILPLPQLFLLHHRFHCFLEVEMKQFEKKRNIFSS